MEQVEELKGRVKSLIVRQLKLEIDPATIKDDAPLFGDDPSGLGLDSIDALELVLGIEKEFGIKVQDEEVGANFAVLLIAKLELEGGLIATVHTYLPDGTRILNRPGNRGGCLV